MADSANDAERNALLAFKSVNPSPDTNLKIIKRIRALVLKLLPVEVELSSLSTPTSRIITPNVVKSFSQCAGDFEEALPYCLLCAVHTFVRDANRSPADYGESMSRAIACEVLARRIVHLLSPERLIAVMSKRFRYRTWDGDMSSPISALETAIDQHCTIFLSSNEAQLVVESLWSGAWVQMNNDEFDIEYVPYPNGRHRSFWDSVDASRMSVPRYQNWLRIFLWLFFLFVYSQTVQQPLYRLDPRHPFDVWEGILYGMAFAFFLEEINKMYKNLRYYTWKVFTFWTTVSLVTDGLLFTAACYRIMGLSYPPGDDRAVFLHLRSFQFLSCVAPLIWMRLLTVVDGFKYIGTLQICVSRMLQESTIFVALLSVLLVGFMQAMFALDVADGTNDQGVLDIINLLVQALLQSPDFTMSVAGTRFGLLLFYIWNILTTVILLNILISLFSSAYADVTDDAEAEFMSFFAHKTIDMIRAPDNYVYPAPFNLIEIVLVAPWEFFLSRDTYAKLNRVVMTIIFIFPLLIIALFESQIDTKKHKLIRTFFDTSSGDEDEMVTEDENPSLATAEGKISTISFNDLVSAFPNPAQSSEESIISEIQGLRARIEELFSKLEKS